MTTIRRIFVEKKMGFDVKAHHLYRELKEHLNISNLEGIRIINRYDIEGLSGEAYIQGRHTIFSEPNVDLVYDEELEIPQGAIGFAVEYLPGQYDQRADSASQCAQILTQKEKPKIRTAKVILLKGNLSEEDVLAIKGYCINPVEAREADLQKPRTLELDYQVPKEVPVQHGFINQNMEELTKYRDRMGFAMSLEDLALCQTYFRNEEERDPTLTELKVIDTYWSDHCRHTTFLTALENIAFEEGYYNRFIKKAYDAYLADRDLVYQDKERDITLMDMATIAMKSLRKKGLLEDLDVSDEINACSIVVDVDVDGKEEPWLVMFKNETHNHPTEIEPFGGAATCLGGAIRDPLSGRVYVYQAMRVTGSGDPRAKIGDTLPGKLPQRKITIGAAEGYSSYGNQIGLATGHVREIYHEDYIAKRMEIGAVIGAAPKENVLRDKPKTGDLILLVGGRTGRDGCGGATGSSKEHTEASILTCSSEVQKGNPPIERKIQRLFRNPQLTTLIKKCNDFGAGGVSVAIGELADSLEINLDKIPKKYEGLDGTELAISESQERMAVVIDPKDVETFIALGKEENLEVTVVAKVTSNHRLKMLWQGKTVLDINRSFLDTNGVKQRRDVLVTEPDHQHNYFDRHSTRGRLITENLEEAWIENLDNLNVASQQGLVERFDSTIGGGTIMMPFGGKYKKTPAEGMVARIPVQSGKTKTCTMMTFGFDPYLSKWSPFHGAMYAVIDSVAKVVAMGGDYRKIRLTLQEYFEKLGEDKRKWGKPFSGLLGAFYAQRAIGIPAIGGKDSMSGTFKEIHVPPTVVSFGVCVGKTNRIISPELKEMNSKLVVIPLNQEEGNMPNFEKLHLNYSRVYQLIQRNKILSAHTVGLGGIAATLSKMAFGNKVGIDLVGDIHGEDLFKAKYGSLILEIPEGEDLELLFKEVDYDLIGRTKQHPSITIKGHEISLEKALKAWETPLNKVFPLKEDSTGPMDVVSYTKGNKIKNRGHISRPRVFIPIFPGTNCEYDTQRAFEEAGGMVQRTLFKNLYPQDIDASLRDMEEKIKQAQIIALPGGFSAGDEPDGSGKFIATVFRNPRIREAVMDLLKNRDGLIIGICNGFQALVKLGLVPYGEILDLQEDAPTLTFNKIGRHVSSMVQTRIASNLSPWFNNVKVGDRHIIPVSHGEGRFVANEVILEDMIKNGQIATQYVDDNGRPSGDGSFNPNGSILSIEGITSPEGRVLGKMGHSERVGANLYRNIPGKKDQKLFKAGINYYR